MIRQERDSLMSLSTPLMDNTRIQDHARLLTAALLRGSEDIAPIRTSTSQPETGWLMAPIDMSTSQLCYRDLAYPVSNTNLISCFSWIH